jgi:ribosomal protein S8
MITSRYILSNINKAMFNNQKVLILINDYQRNSDLLQLLAKQGFINGFEIRGKYIFIHLRQMY